MVSVIIVVLKFFQQLLPFESNVSNENLLVFYLCSVFFLMLSKFSGFSI